MTSKRLKRITRCPDEDTIARFAAGDADPAEQEQVEEHIATCPSCRRLVSALAEHELLVIRSGASWSETDADHRLEPGADSSPRALTADLCRGVTIGRYVLRERLGGGAMGVVFSAHDPELDRQVALKLLRPELIGDPHRKSRLTREAKLMARLSHPNVCAVHDAGTADGEVFVAMELVVGTSLQTWMEAEKRSWRDSRDALVAAGRGLAAAHDLGIVHRDFKPANVMVGDDGRVCVTDFGLARLDADDPTTQGISDIARFFAEHPGADALTRTGTVLGTPVYMAPEQHAGMTASAQSDQFAFCVSLYQALFSRFPFAGDDYDELARSIREGRVEPVPRGSDVPGWLCNAVMRGLHSDPRRRFRSMHALLHALIRDRRPRHGRVAVVAVIALVVAAVVWMARAGESPEDCRIDNLAGIWDDDRKAALRAAIDRSAEGGPRAHEALIRVERALDRRFAAWIEQRDQACKAWRLRRTRTRNLASRTIHCLQRRLDATEAWLDVVVEQAAGSVVDQTTGSAIDSRVADHAVQGIAALPPVADCQENEAPDGTQLGAEDAGRRARIAELEKAVDRVAALHGLARHESGIARLAAIARPIEKLNFVPLQARALYWRGRLEQATGELDAAEATLFRAGEVAAEAYDDRLVSRAWITILALHTRDAARHEEALRWASAARAATIRAGDERVWALYHRTLGDLLRDRRDFRGAAEHYRRAIGHLDPDHDAYGMAELTSRLAAVAAARGDGQGARDLHQEALDRWIHALGETHPGVAATRRVIEGLP